MPEVERARALIAERTVRRRIADVEDSDAHVCRPHAPSEIRDAIVGRELLTANRIGKTMWCETSEDGPDLGLHLRMAGLIAVGLPVSARRVPRPPWRMTRPWFQVKCGRAGALKR